MKRTIVMLSAVVRFSFTAFAQSKPEPPKRTVMLPSDSAKQDENLPKIDLPEFQITGKETPELIESAKPGWNLKFLREKKYCLAELSAFERQI